MTAPLPRARRLDLVLIAVFLVVICVPPFVTLVAPGWIPPLTDERAPVPRPPFVLDLRSLQFLHRNFEGYWNNAFGLRPALVRAYNRLAIAIGVAPSDQVVIGRAGWWYVGDYYRAVEYQRATGPFTQEELARWQRVLETRHAWLAARGIAYVFAVAPDKGSVYPEYLPAAANQVGAMTRLDQLIHHLEAHSEIRIVDVRAALQSMKRETPVYEPLDSHWNDVGAWVAYAAIANRLHDAFPAIRPIPLGEFELQRIAGQGNDLALLLSLGATMPGDRLALVPRSPRRARELPYDGPLPSGSQAVYVSELDDPALPRAVMFQDSFGEALRPFLSEHFRRILYSWQDQFDPGVVTRERPDVVLQEIVERTLMAEVLPDPAEVTRE